VKGTRSIADWEWKLVLRVRSRKGRAVTLGAVIPRSIVIPAETRS
jgi:hypothetical protein